MIAYDFDLRCDHKSKPSVLASLQEMLFAQSDRGSTAVLIVDECHNLDWEVLEEIRLLGNLENRRGKLLQIILSGQPEFDRKLDAPNLRQLKQRIVLRCSLRPFDLKDTAHYIDSRLALAGMPHQKVFSPELIADIHKRTAGIPRIINAVCDNLLLTCFADAVRSATTEMLDEVSEDMRLEWPRERRGLATRYAEPETEGAPYRTAG
jgi:type II secretory pathway predicted ATPase ExeA